MSLLSTLTKTDTSLVPVLVTLNELDHITAKLQAKPTTLGLDTETTGLDTVTCKLVALQFGSAKHVYILDMRPYYALPAEEQAKWEVSVRRFLESIPCVVGQNLQFDWQVLHQFCGARMDHVVDTMLQEQLIIGGLKGQRASLQALGEKYGVVVVEKEENHSWFAGLDQRPDWYLPFPEQQLLYMARDITAPLMINERQQSEITSKGLRKVVDLENAVLPAFALMGIKGMLIDVSLWKSIVERQRGVAEQLQRDIEDELTQALLAWSEKRSAEENNLRTKIAKDYAVLVQEGKSEGTFDAFLKDQMQAWRKKNGTKAPNLTKENKIKLTSWRQLLSAFNELGIPAESTSAGELAKFSHFPLVDRYLKWKDLNTFVTRNGENAEKGVLHFLDANDRVHPHWHQIGTDTGRSSCTEPNMQQLPKEDEQYPENSVRRAIVAPDGHVLLDCDFPNIEPRIYTDWSRDENLYQVFASGKNMHAETARTMFRLSADVDVKTTKIKEGSKLTYYTVGKTINLGAGYGMGPKKLALRLEVSEEEAKAYHEQYLEAYEKAMGLLKSFSETGLRTGCVTTLLGRRRNFYPVIQPYYDRTLYPDYETYKESEEYVKYSKHKRAVTMEARNAPIQGSAADIFKVAMLLLYRNLPEGCFLIAAIHDEVLVECPVEKKDEATAIIQKCMLQACRMFLKWVPFPEMDVACATYWSK